MAVLKNIVWEYKVELFTNEQALNKMGKEGWELVCPGGKDGNYLIFKRSASQTVTAAAQHTDSPVQSTPKPAAKKSFKDFI